jgi:hypothetical protein
VQAKRKSQAHRSMTRREAHPAHNRIWYQIGIWILRGAVWHPDQGVDLTASHSRGSRTSRAPLGLLLHIFQDVPSSSSSEFLFSCFDFDFDFPLSLFLLRFWFPSVVFLVSVNLPVSSMIYRENRSINRSTYRLTNFCSSKFLNWITKPFSNGFVKYHKYH